MNISDLSQKRREHVHSCRLNGDHSHSIIANLYSDSTHFLYELLQNAQDADATTITFTLYPDRLESSHNGRAFSFTDVEAITTIGSSTKAGEANKIGKFGAGFKSVFSITKTPHIYSNPFCFKISDYIIPEAIEAFENYDFESTVLILPFNRSQTDVPELYESIVKRLRTIGKDELLFLSNLERIDWQVGEESGFVEKRVRSSDNNRLSVSIQTAANEETFELYVRDFEIEGKNLQCKIAFAVNEEGRYISIGSNHPLYVFFPTVVPTNLQFLVHAPYKTTPNRETINFFDSQNQIITEHIAELYRSIIIDLADRVILDVDILQLFPLSSQNNELAKKLFDTSIALFKSHPLIPTMEGKYALPQELFAVNSELNTSLFREAQVEALFEKSFWLDKAFHKPQNLIAKRFVNSYLGVSELRIYDIIAKIDGSFLEKQSLEWIESFYGECAKSISYVNGYLSNKPLARLEDGTHIPFKTSQGNVQVYLHPGNPSRFRCIHPEISSSDIAKPFFNAIGIKPADIVDEIREFILPIIMLQPIVETMQAYMDGIKELLALYDTASASDQTRIIDLINSSSCFLGVKGSTLALKRPGELYLPNHSIQKWFESNDDAWMLHPDLWELMQDNEVVSALSCKTTPLIQTIDPHIDIAAQEKLRHTPLYRDQKSDDYEWEGLEKLLERPIDLELSLIIWNFLTHELKNKNILRGYYRWQSKEHPHEKEFDSKICTLFKQTPWLYNNEGNVCKPIDMKCEELAESYTNDTLTVEVKETLSLLGFKTDAIEEIEKMGLKVVTVEEYEVLSTIKKLQEQAIDEDEPFIWNPASCDISEWVNEIDPDIEAVVEKPEFNPKKDKDLRYQTPQSFFEEEGDERQYIPIIPKSIRKSIGEWSEKYVYRYLQDFCAEKKDKGYHVRWMNEEKNVGWGYDFVLMKGEQELRYIEVKGRSSNTSGIEISKTQWEFAKFLFDQGEGGKYSIFIVQNAGKTNVKLIPLNNPVKMWMEGNLSMSKIELAF